MKVKKKAIGVAQSRAALLLALLLLCVDAQTQDYDDSYDSFFYIEEESRNGGTSSWNGLGMSGDGTGAGNSWDGFGFAGDGTEAGAMWNGFVFGDPLPTGAGLLALTVSGLCYAGLKRRKNSKI